MRKLYYATVDVVFVADDSVLRPNTATSFLKEQLEYYDPPAKEITCINQLPEDWQNVGIFGVQFDTTAKQFLEQQKLDNDPEYQEYLRLKKKFER